MPSRNIADLNGTWEFQLDPEGRLTSSTLRPDRNIVVPLPWQAAFPELERYSGYAWYRRTVEIEAASLEGRIYLDFGAVDYWCQVFVNDTLVGEHEGGYTPFSCDASPVLQPGTNILAVRVYDSAQESIEIARWHSRPSAQAGPPFDPRDVPHGKQEWYLNVGGIWQYVELRAVPNVSLARIHVTPEIATATATVKICFTGDLSLLAGANLKLSVGKDLTTSVTLESDKGEYQAVLSFPNLRVWTLDDPFLYTLEAELNAGDITDSLSTRFGMRSFTFSNGVFLLNGEPLYLLSALDQDFYPDTIYTVPSDEFLRDQFTKAKELGLNNLRCHIKPPDPRYLDLADEMGLLVWAEIPSWRTFWNKGTLNPATRDLPAAIRARVEQLLEETVARDYNHPSLVIWTLVNEDWGTTLQFNADDRSWLKTLYERCKQLDPTRLVVDNSPCGTSWGSNIHVKSDIDDFHVYYAIPDHATMWSNTIAQFALRPLWTYSAHSESERRGDEPLVLSEFGNWGLPSLAALCKHHSGEVPWFDLGPWWSGLNGEAGYPIGVEQRFAALGLNAIWSDYEALATATQWHQFEAMKYEIEEMRRHPTIAGYVITEFTDCYWESNGLLDFARNPKAYHARFAEINAPDVIVPTTSKRAFWGGETVTIELTVSHYTGRLRDGGTLVWQLEGGEGGTLALAPQAVATTAALEALSVVLPEVQTTGAARISFMLKVGNAEIVRNELALTVYPARAGTATRTDPIAAVSLSATLPTMLHDVGYRIAELGEATLAVSNFANAALLDWVRDGGDLLMLCEGQSPFFWTGGRGAAYSGDWMTSFNWIKPACHPSLPNQNPLGFAYQGVTPNRVILGLPLENPAFHDDVLAGMFSGWVGLPAAYTVQFRYGAGRVVMTTFPLREHASTHPTAAAMLHDLIRYLGSEHCQPTLRGA